MTWERAKVVTVRLTDGQRKLFADAGAKVSRCRGFYGTAKPLSGAEFMRAAGEAAARLLLGVKIPEGESWRVPYEVRELVGQLQLRNTPAGDPRGAEIAPVTRRRRRNTGPGQAKKR